jgi:hypothetical protein
MLRTCTYESRDLSSASGPECAQLRDAGVRKVHTGTGLELALATRTRVNVFPRNLKQKVLSSMLPR